MNTPAGRNGLVLYADFDGVLHHSDVFWQADKGFYLRAPERYKLFQHANLLTQQLAPFPEVQLVLSTSWAVRYGVTNAAKRLPHELQARVIGGTFDAQHMRKDEFQHLPRGQQVFEDVLRRQPRNWLALDGNGEGWPTAHQQRFVQTHMYEGISDPDVLATFKQKLEAMCRK